MNLKIGFLLNSLLIGVVSTSTVFADNKPNHKMVERGKYLVTIGGCNDCHTPGYPQADGKLPESQWLVGNALGYQGPWGTTYPANLRLVINDISEQEWVELARKPRRPPMPWFNLRDMSDKDLRAIYHFVRQLGPTGEPAPAYAPPGQAVTTPYFEFVPKNLPSIAHAGE